MTNHPLGFVEFLRAAKAATYAAQGDEASVAPLLPGSKQLEFHDGSLLYRDIYVGLFRFVGMEVVYSQDRTIWSMSYAGGLSAGVAQSAARPVYGFLRRALRSPAAELPVRGPAELIVDDMKYSCQWHGDLDWFYGSESIAQNGQVLYELQFSGGALA